MPKTKKDKNNAKKIKHKKKLKTKNINIKNKVSCKLPNYFKPTGSLRQRMLEKLKGSKFRFLNEQLYTSESKDGMELFKSDPEAFKDYHEGFRIQVKSWPINPLDIIIKNIRKLPIDNVIADFGCGEAKLSENVKQKVHSFDFVAVNEKVTECDMANVPLKSNSVDVVVCCLSLMGTNINDHIKEANRILKMGGILKIAEVESRFDNIEIFINKLKSFGFKNVMKDMSFNLFYFMDFKKTQNVGNKLVPKLKLNPCLYKKR